MDDRLESARARISSSNALAYVAERAVAARRPIADALATRRARLLREYAPYLLALYLLASSKWGSYIVPGPPYIADLVIFALVAERVHAAVQRRPAVLPVDGWLAVFAATLIVVSSLELLLAPISFNSLRDAAPYMYSVLIFLVPPTSESPRIQKRMSDFLMAALAFHALWITLAVVDRTFVFNLPLLSGQIHIFEARDDFDGLVCGVFSVLALHRLVQGRNVLLNLLFAAWGGALVFGLESRAGLLAFFAQLVILVALSPTRRQLARRFAPRFIVVAILAVTPVLVYEANHGTSAQRLFTGLSKYIPFVSPTGNNATAQGAVGSQQARSASWHQLIRYIQADRRRNYVGVGFGPDFLHASGADLLLLGAQNGEVRSPHNYFLNTWARIGLVGLVLVAALILTGLRLGLAIARYDPMLRDVDLVALMLVATLPIAAALGVVLESPFGALPWFWGMGHLSARAIQLRVARPLGALAHG